MLKNISLSDQKILIGLAKRSIDYGFSNPQGRLPINLNSYSEPLRQKKACFVTLEKNKQLRGCIGTLMARSPLAQEVVDSAFSTAFLDQRFFKVTPNEFPELTIHISVLTTPEIINFTSEQDLLTKIRPNIDGLILKVGNNTGTFLPSVWEQLPNKQDFLRNLKNKAGLPIDYWSNKVEVYRYETEMFGED